MSFEYKGPGWYRTRDGREAKVVFDWRPHQDLNYPLVGILTTEDSWTVEGRTCLKHERGADLITFLRPLDSPGWEPLTEETKTGWYEWTDGKGGVVVPAYCCGTWWYIGGNSKSGCWSVASGKIAEVVGGYVRPYKPSPGPILEKPIQGEWPERGILSDGNTRWRASKLGNRVLYNGGYEVNLPCDGYTFTPEAGT